MGGITEITIGTHFTFIESRKKLSAEGRYTDYKNPENKRTDRKKTAKALEKPVRLKTVFHERANAQNREIRRKSKYFVQERKRKTY